MQDELFIKAPAKINLFLKILNKRKDGFHNIRSGATFINLYDEVYISLSDNFSLSYSGQFKPKDSFFENDIILKTLNFFDIKQPLKILIKKNIPTKAGLGSASTNAAVLIKALEAFKLIKKFNNSLYSKLGSDIPVCLYGRNCLVTGLGDRIYGKINFPKYFFILIKPKINFSTSYMYKQFHRLSLYDKEYNQYNKNSKIINEYDVGNDFEKIVNIEQKEISNLLDFLASMDNSIFSRMTGSGSCCYVVFDNKLSAERAIKIIKAKFFDLWTFLGENNSIIV